jgi:hypothetical protein
MSRHASPREFVSTPSASSVETALWAVAVAALAADTVLTLYGLHLGHTEANPLMRAALTAGPAGLVGAKLGALAVALCCRPLLERSRRALIPATLAAPWLLAAVLNATLVF